MDEGRESSRDGTGQAPVGADPGRLTVTQKARSAYVTHATECPSCSDIDRTRCGDGTGLWRAWEAACDDAFQRLGSEIRRA